jgi:hypothetical protein
MGPDSRPLPQSFVGLSEVEVETAGSQQAAHSQNDLSMVEWLRQKVICTQHESAVPSGPARISCEHDDRDEAQLDADAAQPPEDFETIWVGHVQIKKHDVRFEVHEDLFNLPGLSDASNRAGFLRQKRFQSRDAGGIVVDD